MILSCRPEDGCGCQNAVPYCGLPLRPLKPNRPRLMICRRGSRRRFRVVATAAEATSHTGEEMRARVRGETAGELNLSASFGFIAWHLPLPQCSPSIVYCIPRTCSAPLTYDIRISCIPSLGAMKIIS